MPILADNYTVMRRNPERLRDRNDLLRHRNINPAYLALKRKFLDFHAETNTTMAAVPENLDVKIGDVVELNSRYRDPSLPCHYIPWTVGRLVDHAPQ